MKKPIALAPSDPVWEIAQAFNTSLVVRKDLSALPLSQILVAAYFYRHLGGHYPEIKRYRLIWSIRAMMLMLGSEWCHNLAHAYIADQINKPIDAIRINFGMPLLVYFDPDDPGVSPQEHILRALGGPVFNLLTLLPLFFWVRSSTEGSPKRFLARLAFDTNLFLAAVSLSPMPSLDGGPLLKWSLVTRGKTSRQAETIVKRANGASAALFALAALLAKFRGRKLLGALLGFLGVSSLAIALGWLDEAY